uniref:SFRICE_010602 n=1 Tax=Spodoptera frugiperda TaxID=7108 RepID=A0A2H1WQH4_SPOFR
MYTNPFERKHSSLRQALDRFMRGETRLSFRKKTDLSKSSSSSTSSMVSSNMDYNYKPKFNEKRSSVAETGWMTSEERGPVDVGLLPIKND